MARSRDVDRTSESQRPSDDGGERSTRRKTSPLWSVLLVITFAGIVGTCCLCGVFVYRQRPSFQDDPAAAVELTGQMLSIDIPQTFAPKGTIEWHVWWFLTMRGAYFTHTVDDGELTLLEVDSRFLSQPEFHQHIVDSLHQQGAGSGFDLNVLHTETKVLTIGGAEVPFEFLTAEDRSTGAGRRLVDGVVTGKRGPVLVSLWVDEDIWDEESVIRMLESVGTSP